MDKRDGRLPLCVENSPRPGTSSGGHTNSGARGGGDTERPQEDSNIQIAKEKANRIILEAERFKASVSTLPGTSNNSAHSNSSIPSYDGAEDDMFFHVTCHLDPMLRERISRGEFVELDRLLPRQRSFSSVGEDNRMNIVQRDGQTFFVPAASPKKINSVCKWEQAFRIYAAVYSEANPSRAAEIWQYVHVINVAAAAYVWDNVSFYDITFRQLMASNPARPWSKIYNQMWNIAMREPLNRGNWNYSGNSNSNGYRRNSGGSQHNGHHNGQNSNNQQKRKPRYCWVFGRGGNCRDGDKCKFVHRCSYCDKADHYKNVCPTKGN